VTTIVHEYPQYIENNYYEQTTNDFDINNLGGDIDIDTGDVTVGGEGNVVTTGDENDVNAATGEGASAAQAGEGGVANTGDEAIVGGVQLGQFSTGDESPNILGSDNQVMSGTGVQADGDVEDVSTIGGDNSGVSVGDMNDSSLAFGGGDSANVSNNDGSTIAQGDHATASDSFNFNTGDNVQQSGIGDNTALQVNVEDEFRREPQHETDGLDELRAASEAPAEAAFAPVEVPAAAPAEDAADDAV
jgi:hypothetical protein